MEDLHLRIFSPTKSLLFVFLLLTLSAAFTPPNLITVQNVSAVGTWHGKDFYHIPMSWCAVHGSPAVDSPNVPNRPNPNDVDTDSILWRRHERPTDSIWIPQAGITMRSAIDDAWTSLDFPKITDPDPPDAKHPIDRAKVGDVEDPNIDQTQMTNMINACRKVYSSPLYGRSGVGITIVNVNLMHDDKGKYNFAAGFGRFAKSGVVYKGDIAVIDNHYLFPGIAPPPDAAPLPGPSIKTEWNKFSLTDPLDQLVGHELGHTLGLNHRTEMTDIQKLMYPTAQDANLPKDTKVDNIRLDSTAANPEVTTARTMATQVPYRERDPVGKVLSGDVVETINVDDINDKTGIIPSYIDLSAVRVVFNTKENKIHFGQELMGIIPNQTKNLQYWTLVDVDNRTITGGDEKVLRALGAPLTNFTGTDLAIKTQVEGNKIVGSVWKYENGNMTQLSPNAFRVELVRMDGIVDYAVPGNANALYSKEFPMNHIVSVMIDNKYSQVELGKPFNVQTVSIDKSIPTEPNSNNSDIFQSKFIVDRISFPHCFPQSNATAGTNVTINLEGLRPNSGIHGLIGPTAVFHGKTNESGGGTIKFPIPDNATEGLHLITIGIDHTALTADCEVNVLKPVSQKTNVM
jgi:hypothetical protein